MQPAGAAPGAALRRGVHRTWTTALGWRAGRGVGGMAAGRRQGGVAVTEEELREVMGELSSLSLASAGTAGLPARAAAPTSRAAASSLACHLSRAQVCLRAGCRATRKLGQGSGEACRWDRVRIRRVCLLSAGGRSRDVPTAVCIWVQGPSPSLSTQGIV